MFECFSYVIVLPPSQQTHTHTHSLNLLFCFPKGFNPITLTNHRSTCTCSSVFFHFMGEAFPNILLLIDIFPAAFIDSFTFKVKNADLYLLMAACVYWQGPVIILTQSLLSYPLFSLPPHSTRFFLSLHTFTFHSSGPMDDGQTLVIETREYRGSWVQISALAHVTFLWMWHVFYRVWVALPSLIQLLFTCSWNTLQNDGYSA